MSKATYPLKLPASIKAAAARLAKEDGISRTNGLQPRSRRRLVRSRRPRTSSNAALGMLGPKT
jgi:hypothetical protein